MGIGRIRYESHRAGFFGETCIVVVYSSLYRAYAAVSFLLAAGDVGGASADPLKVRAGGGCRGMAGQWAVTGTLASAAAAVSSGDARWCEFGQRRREGGARETRMTV